MTKGYCSKTGSQAETGISLLWNAFGDLRKPETIAFADKRKSILVIQILEALWRIKLNDLKPLFSRKKSFAFQKMEGKSCRPETWSTHVNFVRLAAPIRRCVR